ncbi:MAG: lysophospholipid acyltransferase family protein [Planctomycetota bacterium]
MNSNTSATRKHVLIGQLNSFVLPWYLSCLDYKICHYDRSADPARNEYNEHVVFSFWHEFIGVILPRWGMTPITVLCSQHRDGEWVNQTAKALRLNIVRGSTTRGGSSAIRQMKKYSKFSSIAVTPDGPRGPRRKMAMGAVYMASLLKMPLVPMGVGISNPHRLKTWDQFAIPKFGSKIRVIMGPKIRIPRISDRGQLEQQRLAIEQLITDLSDEAQHWADSGKKMVGETRYAHQRRTNQVYFDGSSEQKCPIPKLSVVTTSTDLANDAPKVISPARTNDSLTNRAS